MLLFSILVIFTQPSFAVLGEVVDVDHLRSGVKLQVFENYKVTEEKKSNQLVLKEFLDEMGNCFAVEWNGKLSVTDANLLMGKYFDQFEHPFRSDRIPRRAMHFEHRDIEGSQGGVPGTLHGIVCLKSQKQKFSEVCRFSSF